MVDTSEIACRFCLLLVQLTGILSLVAGDECTAEGDIRLSGADGNSTTEGIVELCVDGEWGTICNYDSDAKVVCRQLNLPTEYAVGFSRSKKVSGPIHFISCTGAEIRLVDCFVFYNGDRGLCYNLEEAGVWCHNEPLCNERDIRLVNYDGHVWELGLPDTDSNSTIEGRVEICVTGVWGTICNDGWDAADAEVACRQLNLTSEYAAAISEFVGGSGPIHYANMHCAGSEAYLLDCEVLNVGVSVGDLCSHFEDAAVRCPSEPECNETDVRLVNNDGHVWESGQAGQHSNSTVEGRVEICVNGVWGTVCDDGWDAADAEVICRQLNLTSKYAMGISQYGGGSGPLYFANTFCDGSETHLVNCSEFTSTVDICLHYEDVGVGCPTERECNETDIRLVGGKAPVDGHVEVCLRGKWGSVCDDEWDINDTTVVCRQLGYNGLSYPLKSYGNDNLLHFHLDDVDCDGTESTLSGIGNHNCFEGEEAGVVCNITECNETDLRLVDGQTIGDGRIEICLNGLWGAVCDDRWDIRDAKVVCQQLGYNGSSCPLQGYGNNKLLTYHLHDVHCTGNESELIKCSYLRVGPHNHCQGAAVGCTSTTCEHGRVYLVGGDAVSRGRVEYCYEGSWYSLCGQGWDELEAGVICKTLGYIITSVISNFGRGTSPILPKKIQYAPDDDIISDCVTDDLDVNQCPQVAGVICEAPCHTVDHTDCNECDGYKRFGQCEAYNGEAHVCASFMKRGRDFVYISKGPHSQKSITNLLNKNIHKAKNLLDRFGKECAELLYRILCHYYLPPCGTIIQTFSPPSLCQKDCARVQSMCEGTWIAAELAFGSDSFINCSDTARSLHPLVPVCCTGINIEFHELEFTSTVPATLTSEKIFSTATSLTFLTESSAPTQNAASINTPIVGILSAVVGQVLLILLCGMLCGMLCRKRNKSKRLQQRMQMDVLTKPGHNEPVYIPEATRQCHETQSLGSGVPSNPYSTSQPEAVTHTVSGGPLNVYENQTRVTFQSLRALTVGKFLVKRENITLLDNIGEGEFGIVYRGELSSPGRRRMEVAVKTLKGDFNQLEVDKFVEESLKMSRFKHSHVMGLIGVCLDASSAPFIIMPYMANGSLLKYLKKERNNLVFTNDEDEDDVKIVCKRLTVMCSQIASGMEYLAAEKYIHRDLAARNCMIDTHFLIKITDFGLSEDVFVRNYFRQCSSGDAVKLPVKWMAPESLSDGHFSEKSDVWSYGVTMWEIFSGGKAPYPGTAPLTIMEQLEDGERMPKPYNTACTDEMYAMMRHCWEKAPGDRPTFKELHTSLTKYIEHIAGYLELGYNPFSTVEGTKSGDVKMRQEEEEAGNESIEAN